MLIPLQELIRKYRIKPEYVLHVGASSGQEAEDYHKAGVKHVTWIEADPKVYEKLIQHISKYPGQCAVNACVSDEDGKEVEFKITNNEGQSSSILDLGTHADVHPDVVVVDRVQLITSRIDTLLAEDKIQSTHSFDFLNCDLQGAEMLALKGMGSMLGQFQHIYIEVNKKHLYKDCPLVDEVVEYLKQFGFKSREVKWTNFMWGDMYLSK